MTEDEKRTLADVEKAVQDLVRTNGGGNGTAVAVLGEGAQKIFDQTKGDIMSVFQDALNRLNDTRRACDAAEQQIKDKRADVERALFEYVQTVETLANNNHKMQQAIGDMAAVNEQV
jgi:hypothetical protein